MGGTSWRMGTVQLHFQFTAATSALASNLSVNPSGCDGGGPSVVGTSGGTVASAAAPLHSAAPGPGASYGRAVVSLGLRIRSVRPDCHLGRLATSARVRHRAGSRLASAQIAEGDCMDAARTPAQACDDLATFSLRGERPGPAAPQGSLELSPKGTIRELMIALVALLVALVHHRRSYSVTLDNRTGPFPSPRQMRGSLRWSVTQRD